MGLITGAAARESILRGQSNIAARAEVARSSLVDTPVPGFTFGQQLGAAFRTENLFLTNVLPFLEGSPTFSDDEGFDPAPHLGRYAQFVNQFPELERAGSMPELAHIMRRIDQEAKDRGRLEEMGLLRSLAIYLPAGLLSPENFIPIGGAVRAAGTTAKIAGKVGAKAARRSVLGQAARTGAEGVITASLAELAIQPTQGFRTTEEGVTNVIGAGLFGSLLGGGARGVGKARSALLKKMIGHENVTDAVEDAADAIELELAKPSSELGLRIDALNDKHNKFVEPGGTASKVPRERQVQDDAVFDSDNFGLTMDSDDPLRGVLLGFLKEYNPGLAKLIGADSRLGRLMVKAMFLNPSMRTARSQNETTRILSNSITGGFLVKGKAPGLPLEAKIDLAEASLTRQRMLAGQIWTENRKLFKELGVEQEEFGDLAGLARRRGNKITDEPMFDKVRGNPQAVKAVEERAARHQQITEVGHTTADLTGALTKEGVNNTRTKEILALLDMEHLARVVQPDVRSTRRPEFLRRVEQALEARSKVLVPEFKAEAKTLEGLIENAGNPDHRAVLQEELNELNKWIETLGDPKNPNFENAAISIVDNYLLGSAAGNTGSPFQSSLRARVFQIDELFLEDFLVSNVDELEARMIRSVIPDLMIAHHWDLHFGGSEDRNAHLGETKKRIVAQVNRAREQGFPPDLAKRMIQNIEDATDDAQALVLANSIRLLRDLRKVGIDDGDISKAMDEIYEAVGLRKKFRSRMREVESQINEVDAEIKLSRRDPEFVESLKARRVKLKEDLEDARLGFEDATAPLDSLARDMGAQQGHAESSDMLPAKDLKFGNNRFRLKRMDNAEEATAQLEALARIFLAKYTAARQYVFKLNLGTEHLSKAIERKAEEMRLGKNRPGQEKQLTTRTDREVRDIETMIARLRNKHGVGAANENFTLGMKRLRDFNFMTKMGSVVISSLPDMALAVSTAGMKNYVSAIARFVKNEMFGNDASRRTYGEEVQRAMERFAIFKRHDKLHGLDEDLPGPGPQYDPGIKSRSARAFDGATQTFAHWTLMDKWNSAHKMIASQAIESRVAKTILAGDSARNRDLAMLEWFGLDRDNLSDIREELENRSINEGGLVLGVTEEWKNRNARIAFETAVFKGVQATIITPSVGDLPSFATSHPLGKMLLQFRSFSFAATNKFVIPGLQRTLALGDPMPAFTFGMITGIGAMVFSINEVLKGRDPRDTSPSRLVFEGIDRGGGMGILTEAGSSGLRALNGLGIEGLGATPSRFQSRSPVDAFLGPSIGTAKNAIDIAAQPFRDNFTKGDAGRLRRMVPFQNLWLTRILFDAAPNAPTSSEASYFDDFLQFQERFVPEQ